MNKNNNEHNNFYNAIKYDESFYHQNFIYC